MVSIYRFVTILLALIASSPLLSQEACTFESRQQRSMEMFGDRLLERVPSVIEECAMGAIDFSVTNNVGRWIDIPNTDFFCGFGATDIWEVAHAELDVGEHRSLEHHINVIHRSLLNNSKDYEIPIPGTSYELGASKVYRHIFKHANK